MCNLSGIRFAFRPIGIRLITGRSIHERQLNLFVRDSKLTSVLPLWMNRHYFLHDANGLKPVYTAVNRRTGDIGPVRYLSGRERLAPDSRQNRSRVFVPE